MGYRRYSIILPPFDVAWPCVRRGRSRVPSSVKFGLLFAAREEKVDINYRNPMGDLTMSASYVVTVCPFVTPSYIRKYRTEYRGSDVIHILIVIPSALIRLIFRHESHTLTMGRSNRIICYCGIVSF